MKQVRNALAVIKGTGLCFNPLGQGNSSANQATPQQADPLSLNLTCQALTRTPESELNKVALPSAYCLISPLCLLPN